MKYLNKVIFTILLLVFSLFLNSCCSILGFTIGSASDSHEIENFEGIEFISLTHIYYACIIYFHTFEAE